MAEKTAKQAAAQERFRAAAKQAKREGKKGKSYARRVGELLRGRASHGGGHKTKASTSHASHGGGSTAEHKPKPRLALYGGIAVGAARLGTENTNLATVVAGPNREGQLRYVVKEVVATPGENAVRAGLPAIAGAALSWGADKLGVNKMLARARMPFRV